MLAPLCGGFGRMSGRKWPKENRTGLLRTNDVRLTKNGSFAKSFSVGVIIFRSFQDLMCFLNFRDTGSAISAVRWIAKSSDENWLGHLRTVNARPTKNARFQKKLSPIAVVVSHSFQNLMCFSGR